MTGLPAFLPPILNLNGEWENVLDLLYGVFKKDFIENKTYYDSLEIIFDNRKIDDDKEEGFWHLITKGPPELRIPDYERAKRLPWVKPCIENSEVPELVVWDYLEGKGKIRVYIWLKGFNYAVILEKCRGKRKHLISLVTAFYIGKNKAKDLNTRYRNRIKSA